MSLGVAMVTSVRFPILASSRLSIATPPTNEPFIIKDNSVHRRQSKMSVDIRTLPNTPSAGTAALHMTTPWLLKSSLCVLTGREDRRVLEYSDMELT
jgi:hypothetical protein